MRLTLVMNLTQYLRMTAFRERASGIDLTYIHIIPFNDPIIADSISSGCFAINPEM